LADIHFLTGHFNCKLEIHSLSHPKCVEKVVAFRRVSDVVGSSKDSNHHIIVNLLQIKAVEKCQNYGSI